MKTFFEFIKEDLESDLSAYQKKKQTEPSRPNPFAKDDSATSNLNRNLIRKDPPITTKIKSVDTTGANSPFADPSVKSYNPVTTDKPMIGKSGAVAKALATKGYERTGEKVKSVSSRPYPDQSQQSTMQDKLNMMRLSADKWHENFKKKMNGVTPVPEKLPVKVGSLAVKQTGYPAASKPIIPIPKERPKDLVPKPKSFKQAFANAPEGSTFTYKGKKFIRKTK